MSREKVIELLGLRDERGVVVQTATKLRCSRWQAARYLKGQNFPAVLRRLREVGYPAAGAPMAAGPAWAAFPSPMDSTALNNWMVAHFNPIFQAFIAAGHPMMMFIDSLANLEQNSREAVEASLKKEAAPAPKWFGNESSIEYAPVTADSEPGVCVGCGKTMPCGFKWCSTCKTPLSIGRPYIEEQVKKFPAYAVFNKEVEERIAQRDAMRKVVPIR